MFNAKQPPVSVVHSIRPMFQYTAHNKGRCGVLSTCDKTWFIRRPLNDPGALCMEGVVNQEDTSPTLLRCFTYIIPLARQDFNCPFPPPSPPGPIEDDHESRGENVDECNIPTYQPAKGVSSRSGWVGGGSHPANAGKMGITSKRNQTEASGKRGVPGNK
jgi:hypothetical protein